MSQPWPCGARIGRYRVVRPLAKGGMAELYLATATGPGDAAKLVALKRIRPELGARDEARAMLIDEARLGARFTHHNLVDVLDLDQVDGEPFYVMRYVPGADLRVVLQQLRIRNERLSLPLAAFIAGELATALHHAHELRDRRGRPLDVVHRDVSTANVRLSLSGGVTLLDFGVAKSRSNLSQTRVGSAKGNAAYMAPEQCFGEAVDRRTDVFALGILLYEMVTMQRLFAASNSSESMIRVCTAPIIPPSTIRADVPTQLEEIILRALQREPARRFASAAAMGHALDQVNEHRAWATNGSTLARLMRSLFQPPHTPTDPVRPHGASLLLSTDDPMLGPPTCSLPTESTDEHVTLPRAVSLPLAS